MKRLHILASSLKIIEQNGKLLKTRYIRTINKLEPKEHKIPITDLRK
jgi:hypothetical protein